MPRLRSRVLGVAAASAVATFGAAGCTSETGGVPSPAGPDGPGQGTVTVLDADAVEADVAEQYLEQFGLAVVLDCDERMVVEVGATYECRGDVEDYGPTAIAITITDENGSYTWQDAG